MLWACGLALHTDTQYLHQYPCQLFGLKFRSPASRSDTVSELHIGRWGDKRHRDFLLWFQHSHISKRLPCYPSVCLRGHNVDAKRSKPVLLDICGRWISPCCCPIFEAKVQMICVYSGNVQTHTKSGRILEIPRELAGVHKWTPLASFHFYPTKQCSRICSQRNPFCPVWEVSPVSLLPGHIQPIQGVRGHLWHNWLEQDGRHTHIFHGNVQNRVKPWSLLWDVFEAPWFVFLYKGVCVPKLTHDGIQCLVDIEVSIVTVDNPWNTSDSSQSGIGS